MQNKHVSTVLACAAAILLINQTVFSSEQIASPDGKLLALFSVNDEGVAVYSVTLNGNQIVRNSELGLTRSDASFCSGLKLLSVSEPRIVTDVYRMLLGKKSDCYYMATRKEFTLANAEGETVKIVFQVSNDGVAFRYVFDQAGDSGDSKQYSVIEEHTQFAFSAETLSWLHPMAESKTGWSRTQPSYEENYSIAAPVGRDSTMGQGWCFPALFKTPGAWVLICETDVDENYCGSHLAHQSPDGVYSIAFAQPKGHRGDIDPVEPVITTPFKSPWRILIVGEKPNTIVESTLMTDLAAPCKIKDTSFVKPGRAVWHWLRYSDESATLEYAESFLDFAVKMNFEYILVDCNWDQYIGYEKMADFVKKANDKGVRVILWYNSNGPWNDAPMTPKNKMHEHDTRCKEFALLKEMGVSGVKVDFFGGDKQATMKLYRDILSDAADFGILVNFHGATIPRGWQRTYPNLMTMESVKGMEYCTFVQSNADLQPQHCAILPFTRNAIGSMDFTPTVFNPKIRGVNLKTTLGFELALSVIFESGIQHFGLVPDEYELMPDYVVSYLQKVPTAWDSTRFIEGYPGEYAVIARQKGSVWYFAGINGTGKKKTVSLDMSFIGSCIGRHAILITDGEGRSFSKKTLEGRNLSDLKIEMEPNGGFVIYIDSLRTGNPIITDKYTADPAALVHDGVVYLYAGHDQCPERQERYVLNEWLCYSSTDMVNWTEHPVPLKISDLEWAKDSAWASQVVYHKGKFYWYVTASHKTIHGKAIGVAVSDSPTGPFKDARGTAIITSDMTTDTRISWDDIDPTVWIDDDGQAYLFWGNTKCRWIKLKENMIEQDGPIHTIETLPNYIEAPWVHKRGDWYYLSYAYQFPEKTAYAMSKSITGPWEYKGIINEIAGNSNTNHQAIINFKGKDYFIYHTGGIPTAGSSFRRSVCIDYLYYNPDGTMKRVVMTSEGVKPAK